MDLAALLDIQLVQTFLEAMADVNGRRFLKPINVHLQAKLNMPEAEASVEAPESFLSYFLVSFDLLCYDASTIDNHDFYGAKKDALFLLLSPNGSYEVMKYLLFIFFGRS